jgi:predicted nucleotidyltransferase
MEVYRAMLRQREAALQARLAERKAQAWEVARAVAAMLRESYGATDVVLFGSLARGTFHLDSDIDLVAFGLDDTKWTQAGLDAEAISGGLPVDIVPVAYVTGSLAAAVERDGISLQ